MQAIIDLISGIGSGIAFVIDYLSSLVSDLAYIATLFRDLITWIPSYLTWLPAGALVVIMTCYHMAGLFRLLKV